MDRITLPENVYRVISRLESAGYPAYAVGGAVRDSVLGRAPSDWDVASAALPEAVMALFGENALPTGLKHGTVTVRSGDMKVEVTTFRTDGSYSDHRRPDSVSFTGSVRDDLSRRDFTMNAVALSTDGTFLDPFFGLRDIADGIIRCVGEPRVRFEEDALRMFRAVRFSCQLGFSIEADTLSAISEKAFLSSDIAAERIKEETEKAIMSDDPAPASQMFTLGLMKLFSEKPDTELPLDRLKTLPHEKTLRWAGLCALLEKNSLARTDVFLTRLRCDTFTVKNAARGVSAVIEGKYRFDKTGWKRLLSMHGKAACRCSAAALTVLRGTDAFTELERILSCGECFSLDRLAVSGADITALGYRGKQVGAMLQRLLDHVIDVPQDNNREKLLSLITKAYEKA